MDKRVLVAFIAFIILLGGIIGMRYLLDPKCEVPVILLSSEKLEIKESISIKTENGRNVQWIINKDTIENKASFDYVFSDPGKYIIKAMAGKGCEAIKEITVLPKCEVITVTPNIEIPTSISENEAVTFKDGTSGATTVNWKIEELNESSKQNPFIVKFPATGKYTVVLNITGKCLKGDTTFTVKVTKQIVPVVEPTSFEKVIKAPGKTEIKPQNEPPPANFITIANSLAMEDKASDDWNNSILPEFCLGAKVEWNDGVNAPDTISIDRFKKNMINTNYKVKDAKATRNGKYNCINRITVYVSK